MPHGGIVIDDENALGHRRVRSFLRANLHGLAAIHEAGRQSQLLPREGDLAAWYRRFRGWRLRTLLPKHSRLACSFLSLASREPLDLAKTGRRLETHLRSHEA